ncbi:MAG: hypothetical protein KTR14_06320 [Vampirovibrio sp.]|nr:hypothetical protein [Vampirovibrio sp.]
MTAIGQQQAVSFQGKDLSRFRGAGPEATPFQLGQLQGVYGPSQGIQGVKTTQHAGNPSIYHAGLPMPQYNTAQHLDTLEQSLNVAPIGPSVLGQEALPVQAVSPVLGQTQQTFAGAGFGGANPTMSFMA